MSIDSLVCLKPECFAFSEKFGKFCCLALNDIDNCYNCHFFRSKEDYEKNVAPLEYKKRKEV